MISHGSPKPRRWLKFSCRIYSSFLSCDDCKNGWLMQLERENFFCRFDRNFQHHCEPFLHAVSICIVVWILYHTIHMAKLSLSEQSLCGSKVKLNACNFCHIDHNSKAYYLCEQSFYAFRDSLKQNIQCHILHISRPG